MTTERWALGVRWTLAVLLLLSVSGVLGAAVGVALGVARCMDVVSLGVAAVALVVTNVLWARLVVFLLGRSGGCDAE